jgi:hypothetical protein
MSLVELLKPSIPVYVLPFARQKMLSEIRKRYFEEIDPEVWKVYFDNDSNDDRWQECVEAVFKIVGETINKSISSGDLASLPKPQFDYLRDSLWEESQSFWHEYAKDLEQILDFADRMHKSAINEIAELFPNTKDVFGPMAYSLLVDLSFQYEFYRYSKLAKPDLFDLRRMINICGQIVESIFYSKLFPESPLAFGQIFDRIKPLKNIESIESKSFLSRFTKGALLVEDEFLYSLGNIKDIRNKYSHGWTENTDLEVDFRKCITALLGEPFGVLIYLYKIINSAAA